MLAEAYRVHRPSDGRVYAVIPEEGHLLKIGYTGGTVDKRLAEMQSGSPSELRKLVDIPGTLHLEHVIHRLLWAWHHRGEWFRYEGDVVLFVESLKGWDRSWEQNADPAASDAGDDALADGENTDESN